MVTQQHWLVMPVSKIVKLAPEAAVLIAYLAYKTMWYLLMEWGGVELAKVLLINKLNCFRNGSTQIGICIISISGI